MTHTLKKTEEESECQILLRGDASSKHVCVGGTEHKQTSNKKIHNNLSHEHKQVGTLSHGPHHPFHALASSTATSREHDSRMTFFSTRRRHFVLMRVFSPGVVSPDDTIIYVYTLSITRTYQGIRMQAFDWGCLERIDLDDVVQWPYWLFRYWNRHTEFL